VTTERLCSVYLLTTREVHLSFALTLTLIKLNGNLCI